MKVQFRRTGERRYAVTILQDKLPPIEMNPAPGYDPFMPHDLLHLVVESELGLRLGVFGQIAQGGHAGTFFPITSEAAKPRATTRQRRRLSKRGNRLLREGRDESAQSERATYICLFEWLARSGDIKRKTLGTQMAAGARHIRELQSEAENRALNEEMIRRICVRLDELSARWADLRVDEALTVEWPDSH